MLMERDLAIVAIVCGAIGISMLFAIENAVGPRAVSIAQLDESWAGERVSVTGNVEWVLQKDNFVMITLNDGGKINAIKFNPAEQERQIAYRGNKVEVVGKVEIYKQELEIVAGEIKQC